MEEFKIASLIESDFSQYKSIEDLKRRLAQIKKQSFRNLTPHQIINILLRDLCFIPANVAYLDPPEFNKRIFYRVRLNIGPQENINLAKTYSYPPPSVCKKNGRANLKNQSVFYCSNLALTSILETRPKVGDFGNLSIWKGNTDRKIKAGFFLLQDLKKENPWSSLTKDFHLKLEEQHHLNPSNKHAFSKEVSKFIAEMFLEEKADYPITSCISHEAMFGEKYKDLLVYPSNAHLEYMCNYAFHPECVDRYLSLEKVIRFKVTGVKDGSITYIPGYVGEFENGKMVWRHFNIEEADFDNLPAEF